MDELFVVWMLYGLCSLRRRCPRCVTVLTDQVCCCMCSSDVNCLVAYLLLFWSYCYSSRYFTGLFTAKWCSDSLAACDEP